METSESRRRKEARGARTNCSQLAPSDGKRLSHLVAPAASRLSPPRQLAAKELRGDSCSRRHSSALLPTSRSLASLDTTPFQRPCLRAVGARRPCRVALAGVVCAPPARVRQPLQELTALIQHKRHTTTQLSQDSPSSPPPAITRVAPASVQLARLARTESESQLECAPCSGGRFGLTAKMVVRCADNDERARDCCARESARVSLVTNRDGGTANAIARTSNLLVVRVVVVA